MDHGMEVEGVANLCKDEYCQVEAVYTEASPYTECDQWLPISYSNRTVREWRVE